VSPTRRFTVLIGTDGSTQANAAVSVAASFPWPRSATARLVLARGGLPSVPLPTGLWEALDRTLEREALGAQRILRRRWGKVPVSLISEPPIEALVGEARRRKADVIVVGSRGRGAVGGFLLGSVSRGVVRRALCAVLVVRGSARAVRRLVVGLDGSRRARSVVSFLARLEAPAKGHVTLVRVVEPIHPRSLGLLPRRVRATLAASAAALNAERLSAARLDVESTGRRLERRGWTVRAEARAGVPLEELLREVQRSRADVLAVGARGVGGVERLLLGSVAEGALGRSPASVLLVR